MWLVSNYVWRLRYPEHSACRLAAMCSPGLCCTWQFGRPPSVVVAGCCSWSDRRRTGQFDSQQLWALVGQLRPHTVGRRPRKLPLSVPADSKSSMCRMYDRTHNHTLRQVCSHLIKHKISIFFFKEQSFTCWPGKRKSLLFDFVFDLKGILFSFFACVYIWVIKLINFCGKHGQQYRMSHIQRHSIFVRFIIS